MCDEEIIAVRRVRHKISEECGHDVDRVAAYYERVGEQLRREEKVHPKSTARRNPPKTQKAKRK